jgi:cobalt-zinc-cadmium efflux system protein
MHDHNHCSHDDHRHHGHDHQHHHSPKNYNKAFFWGISLNLIFVIIETVYGFLSHSLALMADAGHNLSDVAALIIAWGAFWLSQKNPTSRFTFGLRKSSILSALFNSLFLLVAVGIILWEAFYRLLSPNIIETKSVMIVAGIGIVINSLTAFLFFKDKDTDLNIRGAYLHMATDALVSLGVVISAFVVSLTSWQWPDPIMSIIISFVIIFGTWKMFASSLRLTMDAVPDHIDPMAVKNYLSNLPGVLETHDLHIWAMSSTETALTAHLTLESMNMKNSLLQEIANHLKVHFNIHHPTIQIELYDEHFECHFKPENIL